MNDSELRAKIEELEELAPHVPPAVLAGRLLVGIGGYLSKFGEVKTDNMAARFAAMPPVEEQAPPVEEEPPPPLIAKRAGPETSAPVLDPGIPANVEDRSASEIPTSEATGAAFDPEERSEEEYWQEMKEREEETPSVEASEPEEERAEETKPCRRCGEDKPLSRYGKDVRTPDSRAHTCLDCKTKMSRAGAQTRVKNRREAAGNVEVSEDVGRADQPAPEPEGTGPDENADAAQGTKLCTRCGDEEGPKPLSEFAESTDAKNTPDGRVKVCKACRSAIATSGAAANKYWRTKRYGVPEAREAAEPEKPAEAGKVTVLPPARPVPELDDLARGGGEKTEKVKKPERYCANGEDCMAVPHTGRPTKLSSGNKGKICHGCEERATGRFGVGA